MPACHFGGLRSHLGLLSVPRNACPLGRSEGYIHDHSGMAFWQATISLKTALLPRNACPLGRSEGHIRDHSGMASWQTTVSLRTAFATSKRLEPGSLLS